MQAHKGMLLVFATIIEYIYICCSSLIISLLINGRNLSMKEKILWQ